MQCYVGFTVHKVLRTSNGSQNVLSAKLTCRSFRLSSPFQGRSSPSFQAGPTYHSKMAFTHSDSMGWHEGEQKMHSLMRTPAYEENPTSPFLTPGGAHLLQTAPLLALGTLDREGWPWTSLWGGEPGFARSLGSSVVGIKNLVDRQHDPVSQALLGGQQDGEVARENGQDRFVSGLAIDLSARRRVKFAGHMMAGAMGQLATEPTEEESKIAEAQIVVKVDSSLGKSSVP